MDHDIPPSHLSHLKKIFESINKIRPDKNESPFAYALLNGIALDDFIQKIEAFLNGRIKLIPEDQFSGASGTVCAIEVEVRFDKGKTFKVIKKGSFREYGTPSSRKYVPRVFLIKSDSVYVADAKWAVYEEFQYYIDENNIYLQHTYEDYEEVTKVCAANMISSFSHKVRSVEEAVPVDDVSTIVNEAARKSLSSENIKRSCKEIYIIIGGENVGRVGSGSYRTRNMFQVNDVKELLVKETLKRVGNETSSEICKGLMEQIQSKVQENLEQGFEKIEISLSHKDFEVVAVAMGAIIVSLFMPLVGIILAVATLLYTVLVPVDINSSSWRNDVADEIYENVRQKRDEILRKVKRNIEDNCRRAVVDLDTAHDILKHEKSNLKAVSIPELAKEWKRRKTVQSVVDVKKYPSILKFIAGQKSSKPVVKVFLSHDDKDAENVFKTNKNFPTGTVFEFVNVTEKAKGDKKDIKKIQSLEQQAPAIQSSTRKHLCEVIKKYSKHIYAKYSNVISIGMSPVLSDGTNSPCIILYCLDKNLTPYGELHLPEFIHGYPCDVREDFVQLGYCENCPVLDSSCSIGLPFVPSAGSAGFLVKSNLESFTSPVGFLTAAHVAVEKENSLNDVVHPSWCDSADSAIIGNVVQSFLGNTCGETDETIGMDAAFVKLNQPRVKEHVVVQTACELPLVYDGSMEVQKRGRTTKTTVGILKSEGESVRIDDFETLNDCYIIRNKGNVDFFLGGDSGSGVYLIHGTERKLKPLGIAFAHRIMYEETAVCRIDNILQKFNISVIEEIDEEPMDTT